MRHFLSLGGGVQSTAMALMALNGDIDATLECIIFADTGWEREQTYHTVDFIREQAEAKGIPVITVSAGNIREDALKGEIAIPFIIRNQKGSPAMLSRLCTNKYKIRPINAYIRSLGATLKDPATVWIGISVDEAHRMKPAPYKYLSYVHPLIDKRMSRQDCINYLYRNGYEIPVRSSCVGCPMQNAAGWKNRTEEEIADAADFEQAMQDVDTALELENEQGQLQRALHHSLKPIGTRPFDKSSENQLDFDDMCGGGCFL